MYLYLQRYKNSDTKIATIFVASDGYLVTSRSPIATKLGRIVDQQVLILLFRNDILTKTKWRDQSCWRDQMALSSLP